MKKKVIIVSAVVAAVVAAVTGIIVGCKRTKKYGKGHRWFDDFDPCDYIYEEDNEDELEQ